MLTTIMELLKMGMGFFTKTKTIIKDVETHNEEGQIETNKMEIEKSSLHWRNLLGCTITLIIAYNWLIVPLLDFFGIVVIQVPLG